MSNLISGITAFEHENYQQAFILLHPLAQAGNPQAQVIIANMYHLGLGMNKNILLAIQWYNKAAIQGEPLACNNLATIYFLGDDGIPPDEIQAHKWWQYAVNNGFIHSPEPEFLTSAV
jgi:TPR repeat protein